MANNKPTKSNCTFTFEIFTLDKNTLCHDKEIATSNKIYSYEEYQNGQLINDAKQVTQQAIQEKPYLNEQPIEINVWNQFTQEWEEEIMFN